MKIEHRVKILEEELKIIKNEIKTILLDLREQCTPPDSASTTEKMNSNER
jgi:hypothetical protein